MQLDTLITNAQVVLESGVARLNLGIRDGRIATARGRCLGHQRR